MADDRTREDLLREIEELEGVRDETYSALAHAESEVCRLEEELEARNSPTGACEKFLAEIDRPCGSRKFIIPDNTRVHDAIREMADAIGRNI